MNLKKQLFFAMAAALSLQMATAQTGVPEGMEITAQEWCKSVKAGWNLGNTFESCGANWDNSTWTWDDNSNYSTRQNWETSWGNPAPDEAMIKAVADAGFNAIRIPVRWEPHVTDYSTMAIDPVWMKKVKDVVDLCYKYDMYILLNIHHEMWLEANPYSSSQAKINEWIGKLWTNIATEFKDYNGRLAFAGINEVVHDRNTWGSPSPENSEVFNSYHQTFVDAVRATGGNNMYRNLVVQTYSCNPDYSVGIPTDKVQNRLSVEFHYYQPWNFAGAGTEYYWNDVNGLRNRFTQYANQWWKQGLGVIVGEYGCTMHYQAGASKATQKAQKENIEFYYKSITSVMRELGFAGFAWDNNAFGNKDEMYGIFDRSNDMKIKNTYAMSGIIDGAQLDVEKPEEPEDDGSIWSGNTTLEWSSTIKLSYDQFMNVGSGAELILTYEIISEEAYSSLKFERGDWEENANPVFGLGEISDFVFDLRKINDWATSGTFTTTLAIPDETLAVLKEYGALVYGHGAILKRIEINDPNHVDPTPGGDDVCDLDPYTGPGTVIWEGSHVFNWDEGNFIYIPSSKFEGFEEAQMEMYYQIEPADYHMFQFMSGSWSGNNPIFEGDENRVSLIDNSTSITLDIPSETLKQLQAEGVNVQGFGVRLQRVVIVPKADDPEQPDTDAAADWYHNAIKYYANSGKSIFTGDYMLNWNLSVLKIGGSKFSKLSDNSLLVVYYESSNEDPEIQFSDSWWQGETVFVHGAESGKQFKVDNTEQIFLLSLPSATISKLITEGLDIQGSEGLTVKEVLVLDATSISSIITGDANADHKVDIADVVSVITYLQKVKAGKDVDWIINRKSADVNTTAGVDNDDVKGIADIILAQ